MCWGLTGVLGIRAHTTPSQSLRATFGHPRCIVFFSRKMCFKFLLTELQVYFWNTDQFVLWQILNNVVLITALEIRLIILYSSYI